MNPEMGSVYKMGMNEAAQWFEETGCHFLSYVKNNRRCKMSPILRRQNGALLYKL